MGILTRDPLSSQSMLCVQGECVGKKEVTMEDMDGVGS
jgi:hypothetical protein